MTEFYQKIDPKDAPHFGKGKVRSPLFLALAEMQVGDIITIPQEQQTSVAGLSVGLRRKFTTKRVNDIAYVKRLPDDAS